MIRKWLLPLAAMGLMGFAVYHVLGSQPKSENVKPPLEPAKTPFGKTVAGAGLVEARSENIAIGSPLPGVVVEVMVKVGQRVKVGQPLFRLDDRQLLAERKFRQAAVEAAQAQLSRLQAQPRPEEVPASDARVREAEASLAEQADLLERTRRMTIGSISPEDLIRREAAFKVAKEQRARAQADNALLKAGAWKKDLLVAQAAVEQASAQLEQVKTEQERLVVRALVESEVLQVNVRPGEFVGAPPGQTLVLLGDVERLHVRVDIDEYDIPRFRSEAPARAILRGNQKTEFQLTFVRVEPFVIPKKSLTGDNTERVDTRVLQVIYSLAPNPQQRVYVGQLLDVFIDIGEGYTIEGGQGR